MLQPDEYRGPATDVEATDVEATDVEATDVEATDVEATDVEATDVEATDVEATDVEATDSSEPRPPSRYDSFSDDDLIEAAGQLHGLTSAALRELFAIVAELTRREEHATDGARDAAAWLRYRLGVGSRTACKWATVALALEELPALAEAFSSGILSFDKTASLAEIATPDNEEALVAEAKRISVATLQAGVRRLREVSPKEESEIRARRSIEWFWNAAHTELRLRGRFGAEQGASVTAALDRIAEQLPQADEDGFARITARRADALAELASLKISEDPDPDRATVVIHADLDMVKAELSRAEAEGGGRFSRDVLERLTCDARIQLALEDADGNAVGIGYTSRTIPPYMKRALRKRDRHCVFPGCDGTYRTEGHHIERWPFGPTELENLALLCRFHHRLVHKTGWRMERLFDGSFVFYRPDGTALRDGPPPLGYDARRWMWEDMMGWDPVLEAEIAQAQARARRRARDPDREPMPD